MACDITSGTTLNDCNDVVGGIKTLFITNHEASLYPTATTSGTSLTDDSSTLVFQEFQVHPEKCSLNVRINASPENGTVYYDQELTLVARDLTTTNMDALQQVLKASTLVVLQLNTGEYLVIGAEHGCDGTGGSLETGRGFGDMQGMTINLRGRETQNPVLHVASFASGFTGWDGITQ